MLPADWSMCLGKKQEQECNSNVNVCIWNNGADLIPDHDYCAPRFMTEDVGLIDKCVENKDSATCKDQCQWRRGKIVVENMDNVSYDKPLFTQNFCHPTSTDNWDQ
jgi:hypothetical protein